MGVGVGKNSIMEKNAKRKNTNGVKGHLNICRNVGEGDAPHAPSPYIDGHVARDSIKSNLPTSLCDSITINILILQEIKKQIR